MKKIYFLLFCLFLAGSGFGQTTTFSYTGTIVNYTVPTSVTFINITARGAQGGNSSSFQGGKGANISGDFTVTPGQVLKVLVGEQNLTGGANAGGGGGGSFVWDAAATTLPMIAAGGGGGAGFSSSAGNGLDASTTNNGVSGAGGYNGGGTGGNGGFTPTSTAGYSSWASGGAGWFSNGNTGSVSGACFSNGGNTPLTGGAGGTVAGSASSSVRPGGFGGGGAANARCGIVGGGGGGGYSGGGCGMDNSSQYQPGGGGGSYNGGTNQSNTITTATGHGQVTITVLCNPPGTIGGASSLCLGSTTTMTISGASGGTWSSNNTSVATIGSATGVLTGVTTGVATITYTVSSPCGALATRTITVNALPDVIGGTKSACIGFTSTLTNGVSGGTWTSSNTSLATVGSSTGIVTGVAAGTPTITYTLPSGCLTTTSFTVNPSPAAISGTSIVCPLQTTTLSDATTGGVWSSSNTSLATVGSSSGTVTGVSGGNPVISYTLPTGCFATRTMTVNSMSPITGPLGVCTIGTSVTLLNATPGGTWASGNPGVATIGSATGVATSVALGTAPITYTVASSGCFAVATFGVTGAPNVHTVTGGGGYCVGGTGVVIGLASSDAGVSYQLMTGTTPFGAPVSGAGFAVSFPPTTAAGTYTIVANHGTSCATNMTGSATVVINALPTQYTVTGGGSYCADGTGVAIFLSNSQIGVNYQLMRGTSMIGSPMPGTSASLNFGLHTTAGVYTVVATHATLGCVNNMLGSATVSINPLPDNSFTVTGGGGFCSGGSGVPMGLSGSESGISYQLTFGGSPSGSPVIGTGSAITFGNRTTGGTYTVVATNTTTGCTSTMTGSASVTVNVIPSVFTITGGGAYCSGGTGVAIGLNGSTSGVNYQLFRGTTAVGSPLPGTGSSISFGLFTTAGSYTIVATNATTGCSMNMSGSAVVSINPLPTVFSVTGGGGYCAGGSGVNVGLSGSAPGFTYYLSNGTTVIDAAPGSGSAIPYGLQTAAGFYTVVAIDNLTGCTSNMAGSATVVINPLPTVFTVTGGGAYCAGGTGVTIGLNGSSLATSYQLFNGSSTSGSPVTGTGTPIGFGLRTASGSYTVVATTTATGCTSIMSSSAAVVINPLPLPFTITGGGGYCTGGTGISVGLSGTNTGISYQLYKDGSISGSAMMGTGASIDFGLKTLTGVYTVIATNPTTLCTSSMTGPVTVSLNPLPTAYSVTGGGNYCSGDAGVHIGLGNSATGISYQLYIGGLPSGTPVAGTGSAIDFGFRTAPGTYTVVATNTTTGCTNNMTGSTTVGIQPLPIAFTVTGGGNYCAGGAGVHIGLNASTIGVSYQLYNLALPVGAPVAGTGAAIDMGLITGAGTYTIVGTNVTTMCSRTMTGTATIAVDALPTSYFLTGGGNYCFGATGVNIGLNNSTTGVNYQLYLGGSPVGAPMPGTGSAISYGLQTAVGIYDIIATNTTTGCTQIMAGSTLVNVDPLPVQYLVTGTGDYCPGGAGLHVGLSMSDLGHSYQLYLGTTAVGSPVPGTGMMLDFGAMTATGTYTIVSTNTTTTCTNGMTGSAVIGHHALPVAYTVTGGGNYCTGGTGVNVGLNGSDLGHTYQLYNMSGPVGPAVPGTGMALSFGSQLAGTYTVVATNTTTTCNNNMNGSAVVGTNPLPPSHFATGGGGYCIGGTGLHIGLDGSDAGITYQLFNGGTPSGSPVAGTGSALDFGLKTAAGTYSIVATDNTTSCTSTMSGAPVINTVSLPVVYAVSGGGGYCAGGTGVAITLSGSNAGVSYQLFRGGIATGAPVMGTGAAVSFGPQTTAGTYTVVATAGTTCVNNMSGSATITINALPIAYTVSGGGNYCVGGTGVNVTLSGSNPGISYQLYIGGATPVGAPIAGTGFGLNFGLQTVTGNYTVKATNNATGCTNTMTGSATVGTNALPSVYSVSSTSSNYCVGGTGVNIALTGSQTGVNYQLYHGATAIGSPVPGTGSAIDFGFHLGAGTYTAVAVNTTTGCTKNMASSVTVVIDPLPVVYSMTGGGGYCAGGTGVGVGLSNSNIGIKYQLYVDGSPVGTPVNGTGSSISFGTQSTTGMYTVIATNPATTCVNNMSGAATVSINSLPNFYSVTGGGNFCAGGTGVTVGMSGSDAGINYQLFVGSVATGSPVAGTGSSIDFGVQTTAGNYTVVATNVASGCSRTMLGAATVGVDALPSVYPVTGGGAYCPGGAGVHVGISGSGSGISYQLFNGTTAVGGPVPGFGSSIDFGLQTAAGVYTVVATNSITGCTNNMPGSATVTLNVAPTLFAVTGGGNYCAGTAGVHIGLNGSTVGVSYRLYNGTVAIGTPVMGTGSILDFGIISGAATYTVIATNTSTTCARNMSGSATVAVTPSVTPLVNISSTSGDTVCSGNFTTFTAVPVNGGGSPVYQWSVNGVVTGYSASYAYIPVNGDVVSVTMASSAACAMPSTASRSMGLTVLPQGTPVVSVLVNPGTVVCQGTSVNFVATPVYGGSAPSYTWIKNTMTVGAGPSYNYIPANGDNIYCVMTSNYRCRTATIANSSNVSMTVDVPLTPSVNISAAPGLNIAAGQAVTLTAAVTDGGSNPAYQWLVNGVAVPGANTASYTSNSFVNGDVVTCEVTTTGGCAGASTTESVTISVHGVGVNNVNSNLSSLVLVPNPNKGAFTIKGSIGTTDEEVTVEVTNMLGQSIYNDKFNARNGEVDTRIQLSNVANGMYILNLHTAAGSKVFHIVIEQ